MLSGETICEVNHWSRNYAPEIARFFYCSLRLTTIQRILDYTLRMVGILKGFWQSRILAAASSTKYWNLHRVDIDPYMQLIIEFRY